MTYLDGLFLLLPLQHGQGSQNLICLRLLQDKPSTAWTGTSSSYQMERPSYVLLLHQSLIENFHLLVPMFFDQCNRKLINKNIFLMQSNFLQEIPVYNLLCIVYEFYVDSYPSNFFQYFFFDCYLFSAFIVGCSCDSSVSGFYYIDVKFLISYRSGLLTIYFVHMNILVFQQIKFLVTRNCCAQFMKSIVAWS